MFETETQIIIVGLLIGIFIVNFVEKLDTVAFTFLFALIACVFTGLSFGVTFQQFMSFIFFQPLIYLLGINLVILIAEEQKVFQYMAIRIIFLTKNNPRKLFYLISIICAIFSGFLEDVSVVLIFVPLVIRTCSLLKINPLPYILGNVFSITIGNLLTPYSSSSNILISQYFQLNIGWYLVNFLPLFVIILAVVLMLIDFKMIRHRKLPEDAEVSLLFEIMNPNMLIVNKTRFIRNIIYLIVIFSGLMFTDQGYLIVLIGLLIISIAEKESLAKNLKKLDWGLLFFLVAVFLMVGCMQVSGILDIIANSITSLINENLLLAIVLITVVFTVISSFLSRSVSIIMFENLLAIVFTEVPHFGEHENLFIMALVVSVILGGNLIPQASSHMIKSLGLTKEQNVNEYSYKFLAKACIVFVIISVGIGIGYLAIHVMAVGG
jgi:Na+/H+ antiporter NhaD/arsenite permease-like protein